jgi:curli biogenesis system outer membrane secretion channel CsgG
MKRIPNRRSIGWGIAALTLLAWGAAPSAPAADVEVEVLETARETGPFAYAVDGTVAGGLDEAERATLGERIRAIAAYRLERLLGGRAIAVPRGASAGTDRNELEALRNGRPREVRWLLRNVDGDAAVLLSWRAETDRSGGGLYSARAEAELTLYNARGQGLLFRGPRMDGPDASRQLALGEPGAAMLAVTEATEALLDALAEHLDRDAAEAPETVETTPVTGDGDDDDDDDDDDAAAGERLAGAALRRALARQDAPVAVAAFTGAGAPEFRDWNLGNNLPELLREALDGHADIDGVERKTFQGGGATYVTAAYVVEGEILEYAYAETGDEPGFVFDLGGVRVSTGETAARVRLAIRVREAATKRIVTSETVTAEEDARGVNIGGDFGGIDFGNDVWRQTPIGRATREAVETAATTVQRAVRREVAPSVVVAPEGQDWWILGGEDRGFRPGMIFRAVAPGGGIPARGAEARLRVEAVHERTSVARQVGAGTVRTGQWLVP